MQPHGSDRSRAVGERIILQSRISKGWTPRTAKTLTHSEHPGTTVLWDDEYFEVVSAELIASGGVRYVLEKWRDEHVIRTFERYDDASEARLAADFARAQRQRRHGVLTRIAGVILGHCPSSVQNQLGNELGVSPARMTMISCIPAVVLLGVCAYLTSDAMLKQTLSPIPLWLWLLAGFLMLESAVRFFVTMSQNRGMGSLFGTIGYAIFYALAGSRRRNLPKPFEERGDGVASIAVPPDDVALRDTLMMRGPMLTLLPAGEQVRLARIVGFNYREHAYGPTFMILVLSVVGVLTSYHHMQQGRASAVLSLLAAAALAIEQIVRLIALQRGPAGSVLGFLVRPFVRDLLRR